MKPTLTLHLLDGQRHEIIESVLQLTAADTSGQFGLLPGHEYFITALQPGLLHYRLADSVPHFIASAGGLLSCYQNQVQMVSARFLRGEADEALLHQLDQLQQQEQQRHQGDRHFRQELEHSLLKRLREWSEHNP